MESKFDKAKKILKTYNQGHVIPFLENGKNIKLENEVLNMDFNNLRDLYCKINKKKSMQVKDLNPILSINPNKMQKNEIKKYEDIGINIIRQNKFAVCTMAGGQGTRLGHNKAKGTYKLFLNGNYKYLFEIIVEDLKRANEKYNVIIPWYIMTSNENNDDTVSFLEENNYFGYKKQYVRIFIQDELPLISTEGKMLINEEKTIKKASNGNGGIFNSMKKNLIIDDMEKKGIEWIFVGSVDNILLKNVDILLIGLTVSKDNLIGTRTVSKKNPEEKVGVFCKENNKIRVIEYTELPEEMAKATSEDGELIYGESHIMCNLFNINAVKKCSLENLEYHVALKKASFLDENENLVIPDKPNAYKFEKFIFDNFKLFDDITILRGNREEDFAPVKNKTGEDSPETARKLYENYWKNK